MTKLVVVIIAGTILPANTLISYVPISYTWKFLAVKLVIDYMNFKWEISSFENWTLSIF